MGQHARSLVWSVPVFLSLAVLPSADASAQAAGSGIAHVTDRMQSEVRRVLLDSQIPAISVALVHHGDVVWAEAFGLANLDAGTPATADTYFSAGSTLKPVTAAAVMQLVERGLVYLDDNFNQIVGGALTIADADDVTLRHLLAHHAGLEGPVDIVPLWGREPIRSPEETIEATRRSGPPGVEYRYCNECYTMVGYVIGLLADQPYDEYVAQHIFAPLGADLTTISVPTAAVAERIALPYGVEDGQAVPIEQIRTNVFAAGDAYLRASDMAAFLGALLNGGVYRGRRVLAETSAREIMRAQFADGEGLGINRSDLDGRDVVVKNGIFTGYHSYMIGDPASGNGAYVVANSTAAGRATSALAQLGLRLLWNLEPGR